MCPIREPHDLISDLRTDMKLTQKELSERTGIAASQISRIESGGIKHISGDILVKLAKAFHVSTDYILGLTNISKPKSYDIGKLGLSEGAVRTIVSNATDVQTLNRLLEHKSFPQLIYLIKAYFNDTIAAGVMGRNQVIDMAVTLLTDFKDENHEHKADVQQDIRFLRSQKLGEHEAEIEKIKSTFMVMLRDIKRNIEAGNLPSNTATAEFMQQIWVELAETPRKDITPENVADATVKAVSRSAMLDEDTEKQFRQLVLGLLKNS